MQILFNMFVNEKTKNSFAGILALCLYRFDLFNWFSDKNYLSFLDFKLINDIILLIIIFSILGVAFNALVKSFVRTYANLTDVEKKKFKEDFSLSEFQKFSTRILTNENENLILKLELNGLTEVNVNEMTYRYTKKASYYLSSPAIQKISVDEKGQ